MRNKGLFDHGAECQFGGMVLMAFQSLLHSILVVTNRGNQSFHDCMDSSQQTAFEEEGESPPASPASATSPAPVSKTISTAPPISAASATISAPTATTTAAAAAAQRSTAARFNDMIVQAYQQIADMEHEYQYLQKKILFKKLALTCLQKGTNTPAKEVTLSYNEVTAGSPPCTTWNLEIIDPSLSDRERDYFIQCCDSLGMKVTQFDSRHVVFRKHSGDC